MIEHTLPKETSVREPARLFVTLGTPPVVRIFATDLRQEIEAQLIADRVEALVAESQREAAR